MSLLFWYPSASWGEDEIVVGKTIPLDWGDRVRLGVGVVDGFDWNDTSSRLKVESVEPSNLKVVDGTWVELGEFGKQGSEYLKSQK